MGRNVTPGFRRDTDDDDLVRLSNNDDVFSRASDGLVNNKSQNYVTLNIRGGLGQDDKVPNLPTMSMAAVN